MCSGGGKKKKEIIWKIHNTFFSAHQKIVYLLINVFLGKEVKSVTLMYSLVCPLVNPIMVLFIYTYIYMEAFENDDTDTHVRFLTECHQSRHILP